MFEAQPQGNKKLPANIKSITIYRKKKTAPWTRKQVIAGLLLSNPIFVFQYNGIL